MLLETYIQIIVKRWWVAAITVVVAMAAAYFISKAQTPIFRAEAINQVVPNRNDNGLSIVLRDSMSSFRDLALTRPQLQYISDKLRLDISPDTLLQLVAVQSRPEDRQIIVQVDHADPAVAALLANEISKNMVALVAERNRSIEGTDKISVVLIEPAQTATLDRPKTKLNVAAAGVLGLILGLLLMFILERLDNTLKTANEVEQFVGLQVIGAIPHTESR